MKTTRRKTRKRKVPVVDVDSQTGESSSIVNTEDEDDVEVHIYRNQQMWKYLFNDDNFKYSITKK